VVPGATPARVPLTILAIFGSPTEYTQIPLELDVGLGITANVVPASIEIGASEPIVGTSPVTLTVKVVEFANQNPLAACVNVRVALPAFPTVIESPETLTTAGSLEVRLQAPGDWEVGGVI
jgi:hypothetical protein